MKKARAHSRILVVIPILIAASILALALNIHQVRAEQATITFDQSGVSSDFTGTVVTIDGSNYATSALPMPFSWDLDSVHSFSFASPLNEGGGVQYVWDSTMGLSTVKSGSLTVTESGSVTGNYKTQYYLTVTSAQDSPNPSSGWFDSGTEITESVTSPTPGPTGTQYICTGWIGTGTVPASGTGTSVTFTITETSSIVWSWNTQYYLTVTSAYDSPSPLSGWFDSGSYITESVTSPASGPAGTQYVCTGWLGSGSVPSSGSASSVAFTISEPSSVVWNWKTQFFLTVTSAYDSPSPVSGWFDSGSGITESVTSPVSGGSGIQYVCTGWTGTGSAPGSGSGSSVTFTIDAASAITWNWKAQYQVTFDQTGVGVDFAGTVVSVDSVNYAVTGLPVSFWWDGGSSHSFSFASPLVVGSKQYAWSSTSGLSTLPSDTLTATASGSVVGNYMVQNQVSFDKVGVSSDFAGTVITIDSVSYSRTQLPVSFSWTIGSIHNFAFTSPLTVGANSKQYVWTSTAGLSSLQSGSITVTAFGSIVGNYKTQYYLAVTSPYDSPSPLSGWFDSGSQITDSVTSPMSGGSGIQRVCTGWTGTGNVPTSGTGTSVAFTLNGPSTITWNWKTRCYLTVTSSNGSPNPVSGWFDAGSSVTESINSPIPAGSGTQYACIGWTGTGNVPSSGSSTSTTFTISSPSSITWNWQAQYQLALSTDFGTTSPSGTNWYGVGTNVTISASPPSTATGERYAWNGWTGSGTGSFSGSTASATVTVNGPINETSSWTHQYRLTVSSDHGTPIPNSEWVNDGTQINETLAGSPSAGPVGTQYVCTGWSGTGSVPSSGFTASIDFTINAPSTITWNWKTQYQLTVSSAHSSTTGAGWYDGGSTAYATVTDETVSDSLGTQYVFIDWTGDASGSGLNSSIIMNAPKTATADWKTQYYLTVTSAYSTPSGSGWYDSGSVAYAHLDNGTDSAAGDTQYIFTDWSGDASGTVYSQSNGITMNGPKTATADWTVARHALTILPPYGSLGGSTSPSAGVYPKNDSSPVTVTATADTGYSFTYWVLDGRNVTDNPINVPMTADHTVVPVFQLLNFTLTILPSNNGTTTLAAGTYSYSYGTNVTVTASPNAGYEFNHWILDSTIVTSNPINVTINENHTLQPFFQTAPSPPLSSPLSPQLTMYLTIFAIVAAALLVAFAIFVIIERRR